MKKIKAFSLLEVMIVLAIFGIVMVSISQGTKLLQQAKIYKTVGQINKILTIKSLINQNIAIDASNEEIWNELEKNQEGCQQEQNAAIGGILLFEEDYLILAGNAKKKGALTLSVAKAIKQQIDETLDQEKGIVQIELGSNHINHPEKMNDSAYILKIKI